MSPRHQFVVLADWESAASANAGNTTQSIFSDDWRAISGAEKANHWMENSDLEPKNGKLGAEPGRNRYCLGPAKMYLGFFGAPGPATPV
jgi:hypothetical protein